MTRYRYLLGDTTTEAQRLRAQAKLWDPTVRALFDRLGVRRGWKVLEIGSGQGSFYVELRRRTQKSVDAVEFSAAFRRRLAAQCARDGFGAGRIWGMTFSDAPLFPVIYDLIFARWVFLFLPDSDGHVRKLAAALKPGGLLAIEDYHRDTFVMIPTPAEWPAFLNADHAFFATQGGDASIAGRLPDIYRRAGLAVVEISPNIKTGHPGSPVWNWLSTYFFGVMDRLAAFPPFDRPAAARLRKHWRAAARNKASLLISSAVIDVVGRRPWKGRAR